MKPIYEKKLLSGGLELSFTYEQKMLSSNDSYACTEVSLKYLKLTTLY